MNGPALHRSGFAVWDVVRVEFPYADQLVTRRRPALVIATPEVHEWFAVLWVLMITSARHQMWPGDVAVADLPAAGLSRACFVRSEKVATVDARIATPIGHLAAMDRANVTTHLRAMFEDLLES